jgi:Predicted Zn-dependent peptidases
MRKARFEIKNARLKACFALATFFIFNLAFLICANAQEQPPAPQAPKSVTIPAVQEKKLKNGLTVAAVERKNVPLVTAYLLVKKGANFESEDRAGLASMTSSLLTKGTKRRTATQIAEEMEFLGGSINSVAGWNHSFVMINVTSDKLDQAMAIMADVVMNPTFEQKEIDLLKSQMLDGLAYNLKQPGFLSNYVASAYSFGEHPVGGTPESIKRLEQKDFLKYYKENYDPSNSVLIFTGDITAKQANALAKKYFSAWKKSKKNLIADTVAPEKEKSETGNEIVRRILVVDLPDSGQAAVKYAVNMPKVSRNEPNEFYPALVMNSVLGGGYSARLNQEIRIKRGLSYGAGSSFAWRRLRKAIFSTSTQTKNESAAEVAELVAAEIKRLMEGSIEPAELDPRKSALTGDFGRGLETTVGLAGELASLYTYGLPTGVLNSHMQSVRAVSDTQIKSFAAQNLKGGDMIIVGDYAIFKDDLAKRFPNVKIEVVKADELDLSKLN